MAPLTPGWISHGREAFQIDPWRSNKDVASGAREAPEIGSEEARRVEGGRPEEGVFAVSRKLEPRPSRCPGSPGSQAGQEETQESTVVPASPALVAGSQTASKALSLSEAANPWKTSCTLLQLFSAFIRSSQRFTLGYPE